jgi:hypothetical protein
MRTPARTLVCWACRPAQTTCLANVTRGLVFTAHYSFRTASQSQAPNSRPPAQSCLWQQCLPQCVRVHPPSPARPASFSSPHCAIRPPRPLYHESASLHDGCSNKQVRGGASCDAASPVTCRTAVAQASSALPRAPCAAADFHAHLTNPHLSKQQGDIALKAHVTNICFNYFRSLEVRYNCFISIFKSRSGCSHVAMVIHVCLKYMF